MTDTASTSSRPLKAGGLYQRWRRPGRRRTDIRLDERYSACLRRPSDDRLRPRRCRSAWRDQHASRVQHGTLGLMAWPISDPRWETRRHGRRALAKPRSDMPRPCTWFGTKIGASLTLEDYLEIAKVVALLRAHSTPDERASFLKLAAHLADKWMQT